MSQEWKERMNPARIERRYQFADYDSLRVFLDDAADLSEEIGYYPDMGFGKDYVNIVIYAEDGEKDINDQHRQFASKLDQFHSAKTLN
jgi:pterin-4a-carbinolamine dehydratase